MTHWEASSLATFDEGLAMSLEPGLGVWLNDGSSTSQLTVWQPYALVGMSDRLIAAFDGLRGLWSYRSSTGWTQLSGWEPIHFEVVTDGLAVDFGHGRGLWIHDDASGWANLSMWNATMGLWMGSDGHCSNVMNANSSELGVGYYPGGSHRHYWTQAFARPSN